VCRNPTRTPTNTPTETPTSTPHASGGRASIHTCTAGGGSDCGCGDAERLCQVRVSVIGTCSVAIDCPNGTLCSRFDAGYDLFQCTQTMSRVYRCVRTISSSRRWARPDRNIARQSSGWAATRLDPRISCLFSARSIVMTGATPTRERRGAPDGPTTGAVSALNCEVRAVITREDEIQSLGEPTYHHSSRAVLALCAILLRS